MRPEGNAAKRVKVTTPGPWMKWTQKSRHARAIRFIETYCRPPKGVGFGEPMKLAPWQKSWLEESLASSSQAAVMSLPRGNGKSTFAAGIATWATYDRSEYGAPQVPIIATTVGQAIRSVYGVASAMVRAERELESRSLIYTGIATPRIVVPATNAEMFPIANDVDGLQGLDPTIAIVDEVGFQPIEAWDALLLAGGKRPNSLIFGLGTPGLDRENALWHLRSLLREGQRLPGFVFREYAADEDCDIGDTKQWKKANPALAAGYLSQTALHTALALSPEAHFRVFRLGQWVEGTDSWLGASGRAVWDALRDPWALVDDAKTWVGVDVGLKRDSTAVVALQQRPDGRFHTVCRHWVPSVDEPVDTTDVMQHLRDLAERYDVDAISYDPRFFDVPAKYLEDEGLPMVEIPQSLERMTGAIGQLYEAIQQGRISHDGDPLFATQVLNAVPRFNERGFTLAKGKSRGRIDSAIALSLALDRAQHPAAEVIPLVAFG